MADIQFPRGIPIRFYELGTTPNASYRSTPPFSDWFQASQEPWQRQEWYDQPWQFADRIAIQVHVRSGDYTASLQVVNCSGQVVATIAAPTVNTVPGNEYNGFQLDTLQWIFRLEGRGLKEDRYWFLLTYGETDQPPRQFISEPQFFKAAWPGTLWLQYDNSRNEYDIIWTLGLRPGIRFPGWMKYEGTASNDTTFENQGRQIRTEHADTYRRYTLNIADKYGAAPWQMDLLSEALRVSSKYIDGVRYERAQGETIDISEQPGNALQRGKIELREGDRIKSITPGAMTLQLFQVPASGYPFAVSNVTMQPSGGATIDLAAALVFNNAGQLTAWVTQQNANAFTLGFDGTFALAGGIVAYNASPAEQFAGATAKVLPKALTYTQVRIGGPAAPPHYQFVGGEHVLDVTGVAVLQVPAAGSATTVTAGPIASGGQAVRLFHADDITVLNPTSSAVYYSNNYGGTAPASLQTFNRQAGGACPTFNTTFLQPAALSLTSLRVPGSGITSLNAGMFNAPGWMNLLFIELVNNSISTTDLSNYLDAFVALATIGYYGNFYADGQTPPAPPNTAGQNALNFLNYQRGWDYSND